jgi:endonuclease/exonuclease/phosphatase family metal-dependent hydrolase
VINKITGLIMTQLKILSWNIWYHGQFNEIVSFIKSTDADIIGLQEVVPDDPTLDVIGYLTKLGHHYVVAPVLKLKDGRTMSNAIFSKYEIVNTKTHILSEVDSRSAVMADVRIGNTMLHIFCTHLLHTHQKPSDTQTLQAKNLLKVVPQNHSIVMGDFNATPDSIAIRKMREVLVDLELATISTVNAHTFDCAGCDPKRVDETRLDYIFTSKDLTASDFKVYEVTGSDHLPISISVGV